MNILDCTPENRQETFDFVVRKLIEQGKPSSAFTEEGTKCLYRGPDGVKCGIGHMLADEQYEDWMEGCNAARLVETMTGGLPHGKVASFLNSLQVAHDRAAEMFLGRGERFMDNFKFYAAKVAAEYDLDDSVLKEA